MQRKRNIGREIGTALAVLALYLLTILTPLHQARASQLAFNELGYATLETGWVLCGPTDTQNNTKPGISKCPVAGVGKQAIDLPQLPGFVHPLVLAAKVVAPIRVHTLHPAAVLDPAAPPRAPPVLS